MNRPLLSVSRYEDVPQSSRSRFALLGSLLLAGSLDQGLVDVRQDTTTSNGGTNQAVQLLVATDGKLQVTGSDALDAQVLGRVAREFEDLGGEVLEDGRRVDSSLGADTDVILSTTLQVSVDSSDWELRDEKQIRVIMSAFVCSRDTDCTHPSIQLSMHIPDRLRAKSSDSKTEDLALSAYLTRFEQKA